MSIVIPYSSVITLIDLLSGYTKTDHIIIMYKEKYFVGGGWKLRMILGYLLLRFAYSDGSGSTIVKLNLPPSAKSGGTWKGPEVSTAQSKTLVMSSNPLMPLETPPPPLLAPPPPALLVPPPTLLGMPNKAPPTLRFSKMCRIATATLNFIPDWKKLLFAFIQWPVLCLQSLAMFCFHAFCSKILFS